MDKKISVLLVEDSPDDAALTLIELKRGGFECHHQRVEDRATLLQALTEGQWDIILSDHGMPRFNSLGALACLKERELDIPFIIVSGTMGEEAAVAAMRAGAQDYLLKGNLGRLVTAIEREIREAKRRKEHRQLEDKMRQTQKMEAFGQLAGGIAHDFNNLLTAIITPAEMALRNCPPEDARYKWLQMILKAGKSASLLVDQLLSFSRKRLVRPTILNLQDVVKETATMLRRLIAENIEISVPPCADLAKIKIDHGQLEQLLMNLAINARDAMPKGGKLTIETRKTQVDEAYSQTLPGILPGEYVLCTVTDTGTGMAPEVCARIFEPFFTTKGPGKGTGLGLATVFGIMEQAGGHITVESKLGQGTRFLIYFPVATGEVQPPVPVIISSELPRGSETVLLVEDEPLVRELTSTFLTEHGYQVIEASSGIEAIKIMQRKDHPSIDLLFSDLVMPGMSGRELAEVLQSQYPHLAVLFTSGYTEDMITRQGLAVSAIDLLPKPFSHRDLALKVRAVLDKKIKAAA